MAWINRHPNLVTWAILAVGMVAIVGYSAKDVDTLNGRQWFWLAFATVLVAGLCAWIISWEADDEVDAELDEEYEEGGGGEGDSANAQSDEVDAMAPDGDGA